MRWRDQFCPIAPCNLGWPKDCSTKTRAAHTQGPRESCFSSSFYLVHFEEATKRSPMPGSPPRALVSGFSQELNLSSKMFNTEFIHLISGPYTYWRPCLQPRIHYLWEASRQTPETARAHVFYSWGSNYLGYPDLCSINAHFWLIFYLARHHLFFCLNKRVPSPGTTL